MALLANPLHDYASYNYVWTLSAMYPGEVNDSLTYKNSTGKLPIASSTGLGNKKTVTTLAEDKVDSNVEFFIDDVIIESTVVPTVNGPTTNNATLTFKVYEPYSLGLFLQTVSLATQKAGFTNYLQSPMLLTLQMKGFKDDGSYKEITVKHFVITIAAVSFNINSGGCVYDITATPYNHIGLGDVMQALKTEISLTGETVQEILSTGERSLTNYFNSNGLLSEKYGFRIVPDSYQITFPFDISPDSPIYGNTGFTGFLNDIQRNLDVVNNTVAAIGNISASLNNLGTTLSRIGEEGFGGLNRVTETPTVKVQSTLETIGEKINSLASTISTAGINSIANEIGSSRMIDNFNDFGTVEFANEEETWDGSIYKRGNMTVSDSFRTYTFAAGTTISNVIEEIVLSSKWGQEFLNRPVDSSGMRPWFRIRPKVYITSLAEMNRMGRPSYRLVYEVYPYFIHQSSVSSPGTINNMDVVIQDAVKAYNYIYTGLNRDILDLELNITDVLTIAPSDYNQLPNSRTTSLGGSAVAEEKTTTSVNTQQSERVIDNLRSTIGELAELYRIAGGTFNDTSKTRTAYTFRNLILNNGSNLQALALTIWGDTYYLNTDDWNDLAVSSLLPNINEDLAADYQRSACYVLIKFNTPVDYNNNLLLPDPADQFTGVYQLTSVEHTFQGGQFKQVLGLTRIPNQDPTSVDKLKRIIDSFFAGLGALANLANVTGSTGLANNLNNFMQEASPFADQLLGLANIGNSLNDVVKGDYQTIGDALVGLESFFTNVQSLETQFRSTMDALRRIDSNPLSPAISTSPRPRPTRENNP